MADLSWEINFTAEQVFWADLNCSLPQRCPNKIAFGDNCGHHECAYCQGRKYAATKVDLERTWQNQYARPLSWLVRGLLSTVAIQRSGPLTAAEFDEIEQLDQEIEAKMKQRDWELLDFAITDPTTGACASYFGYTEIPHVGEWRSVEMELVQVEAWISTLEHLAICAELSEIRNKCVRSVANLPDRFQIQGPTKIKD